MEAAPAGDSGLAVAVAKTAEGEWASLPPIAIGEVRDGPADGHVLVSRAGTPVLRIDVYFRADDYEPKTAAEIWEGFVVVGYSAEVTLVGLADSSRRTLRFNDRPTRPDSLFDYFCQLTPGPGWFLATSGTAILCLAPGGALAWRRDGIALDGVLVHDVDGGVIVGSAEWDPPGGWRPFALSLATGAPAV
jgi:hypothetical protein